MRVAVNSYLRTAQKQVSEDGRLRTDCGVDLVLTGALGGSRRLLIHSQ
jgi:hypothetical protein